MIETSMRQLPREVADAYRGLALAPKRLPLDMALLGALLGAPDEETALQWRALLASHSLLHLTEDGMCTAHDLQLDYLKLTSPAKLQPTAARLATLLVAPSTLDRLRFQTSRALGPYCLGLMALWREVERVQGLHTAGPACLGAEAMKPLPVPMKPVPGGGSRQTGGSSAPSSATAEEEEAAEEAAEAERARRQKGAAVLLREMDRLDESYELFERSLALQVRLGERSHARALGAAPPASTERPIPAASAPRDSDLPRASAYAASQAAIGSTLHHMGIVREKQGRLDAAMELYRSALDLWKAAQGSKLLAMKLLQPLESAAHLHAEVATALGSMGSVCEKQGKLDEAMAHYEQALEITESVLGGEHAAAARTRRGMGIVRQRQGRLDEAMAFFERALAIEEVALGTGHVELTSTLMNMGLVRRDQGRLDEALDLYARTLRIREASLGSSHRLTAITLVAMGRVWQVQGRLDEAMVQYERALPIFSSPQVKEHSLLGWVYRSMGSVREEQSRLDEAMALLEQALAIEQAALGGRHPFVGKTLMCMGSVLEKQGRAREAIVYLRRAQEIFTQPSLGLRPSPSQTGLGHAHPLARQVTTSLFRLGAKDEEHPQARQARHDPHSRGAGRARFWCGAAMLMAAAAVGVTIALRRAGSARAPALPQLLPLVPALVLPLWPPLDIAFVVPQSRNIRRG